MGRAEDILNIMHIKTLMDVLGLTNDDDKVFEQVCINGGHLNCSV